MKNSFFDTIAAISTPFGEGGIGIVRVSGENSIDMVKRIFRGAKMQPVKDFHSHSINYGYIVNPENDEIVDEVLVNIMKAPRSFTTEDTVEINCHGGLIPLRNVLGVVLNSGARLAEPGEFTKRAFLNGRLDMSQAEAVIDLIRAKTDVSGELALNQLQGKLSKEVQSIKDELMGLYALIEVGIDFPDEDIENVHAQEIEDKIAHVKNKITNLISKAEKGKIYRDGVKVAIIGRPNVGKSSLLNALIKEKRAIVTEIPGTTRDIIEEIINLQGIPLKIIDTAGIRETEDKVEKIGVEKTREVIHNADLNLFVLDISKEISDEDIILLKELKDKKVIVVANKIDLGEREQIEELIEDYDLKRYVKVSAKSEDGFEELENTIVEAITGEKISAKNDLFVSNIRHKAALENALESLRNIEKTIAAGLSVDFISIDLKNAINNLGEITGETVGEDLIDKIFKDFCLGK